MDRFSIEVWIDETCRRRFCVQVFGEMVWQWRRKTGKRFAKSNKNTLIIA